MLLEIHRRQVGGDLRRHRDGLKPLQRIDHLDRLRRCRLLLFLGSEQHDRGVHQYVSVARGGVECRVNRASDQGRVSRERRGSDPEGSLPAELPSGLEQRENEHHPPPVSCLPTIGRDGAPPGVSPMTRIGSTRLQDGCQGDVSVLRARDILTARLLRAKQCGMRGMRLQADLNVKLRRGAWYRITQPGPLQTVLEVAGRLHQIPSAFLQVVERPPRKWTVVPRPEDAIHLPANWGDRYAVCPSCRERQPLGGHPRRMACNRCHGDYEVAWSEA